MVAACATRAGSTTLSSWRQRQKLSRMAGMVTLVTDVMLVSILTVVIVTCFCAIKIVTHASFKSRTTTQTSQTSHALNRSLVPGFPCNGTLLLLAEDGIMYTIPPNKAVVRTDMVREVHFGQVARGYDRRGSFTYFDDEDDDNSNSEGAQQATNFVRSDWSGSLHSQDATPSLSSEDAR